MRCQGNVTFKSENKTIEGNTCEQNKAGEI